MPADGSGSAVPLALYPYGYDTNRLIITSKDLVRDNIRKSIAAYRTLAQNTSTASVESFGGESNGPLGLTSGGCDCPDKGFFRVWHIPDWSFNVTNYTYDGPAFFPVGFKDYRDRVDNIEVLLNGEPSPHAEFTSYVSGGQTNWGMGIYFDRLPSGTYQIQLRSTLRMTDEASDDATPMLVLSNLTRSIVVDNQVTFTNWDDLIWNNTNYTFKARSKALDTDWFIDIYDAFGNYVNGGSGHTTNGLIEWTWDLRDTGGNLRDSLEADPFFDPYITFDEASGGISTAAVTQRPTPIPIIAYPAQGRWIVTYQDTFYEPGTTGGGYYQDAMNAIAGGPALRGVPVAQVPVKFGTNNYTQAERNDSWANLKAWMFSRESRNLYYFGHGWDTGFGGDTHTYSNNAVTGGTTFNNSKALLTSKKVRDEITYNKHGGARPYRFVWLDGCSTANGDWPDAFGVNKATNSISYYNNSATNPRHKRPSAFVGWNQTIGGPTGWGTLQNFMLFRSEWMFDWQQNWTSRTLTDAFENARSNTGWILNGKLWGALVMYGYNDLRMNQYNQKTDWPGP